MAAPPLCQVKAGRFACTAILPASRCSNCCATAPATAATTSWTSCGKQSTGRRPAAGPRRLAHHWQADGSGQASLGQEPSPIFMASGR
jgi:hypothetical protein